MVAGSESRNGTESQKKLDETCSQDLPLDRAIASVHGEENEQVNVEIDKSRSRGPVVQNKTQHYAKTRDEQSAG